MSMNLLDINLLQISARFFIFTVLLLSFSLLLRHGNVLSLAHAGFFILGYSALLLSFKFNLPFLIAILIPALFSFVLSYVLAASSLKLESYFPMAAFAFSELARGTVIKEIKESKHCLNIRIFEPSSFIVIFLFSFVVFYSINSVFSSRTGKLLKALEEESAQQAGILATIGENPEKLKTMLFLASSSLATLSGSLYAYYIGFSYEHFLLSLLLISSAVLGGSRKLSIALAGLFLFLGYEALAKVAGGNLILAGLIWIVLIFFITKNR